MARTKALACLILLCLAAGCTRNPQFRPFRIGSKNFTEQLILAEIAAQHLEHRLDIRVVRRLNLGGTLVAHQALLSGEIDAYPEYTGTAFSAVLKYRLESNRDIVRERVRSEYARQFQLEWMQPLGFENSFAMVVRGEDARRLNLKTLSDAAAVDKPWLLGVGYEFQSRLDGLPALMRTYKLPIEGAPKTMDLGLLYRAIQQGQVSMAAGNTTDGQLSVLDLATLEDDRGAFPPYETAFIMRRAWLEKEPRMRAAMEELSGKFTAATMRELNYKVDGQKKRVEDVAASFLAATGLR